MDAHDKDQPPAFDKPLQRQIITTVGELQYLIHPQRLGHVSTTGSTSKPRDIIPVTGLTLEQFNSPLTFQIIQSFDHEDDVYMYGFKKTIVIIDQSAPKVDTDNKFPPHRVHGLMLNGMRHPLRPGPYFIYNEGLHQAWRLYPDQLRAFNFGIIPRAVQDPHSSAYDPVTALSQDGLHKAIAVPSRLYYPDPSREKPLSGVRFVVDDLFAVEGVKTTLSHETWAAFYPPCQSTSYFIEKLIELGAVVVGKTKASQFAVLHTAWVDVSSPKNPRADGYQEALGSSPGAGSALAGYKWVDCAVGIDTLGGLMETAEWYGLFALRLSHYWPFLASVNLASSRLSAVAFMSRSLERIQQAAVASIISIKLKSSQQPTPSPLTPDTIIYLQGLFDDERHRNQKRLTVEFTRLFKTKSFQLDLDEAWEQQPPDTQYGQPLQSYMRDCGFYAYCHDFDKKYSRFLNEYTKGEAGGKNNYMLKPYWDDAVDYIWEESKNVLVKDYYDYCARIKAFTEWFDKAVTSLTPPPSGSIVMLPTVTGHQPRSRINSPSAYAPTAHRMANWDECLASILQRPQLILPLGRTFFKSKITHVKEALPLCSSIMGDKDSDLPLLELVIKVMKENELEVKVEFGADALLVVPECWRNFEVEGDVDDADMDV